ncbi:MAG: AAA family ATPase [Patescibacteria group bacterium]
MKKIIIIRGPLGVGKTTVAKKLAEKIDAKYFSVDEILENQALDKIEGESITLESFTKVNDLMIPEIEAVLAQDKAAIIDGNFYFQEVIDDLQARLSVQPKVFTLTASVDTCIGRDCDRGQTHGADAARAVHSMVSKVEAGETIITEGKIADEIVTELLKKID